MFTQFNIWEFFAGLGIFLLAMMLLEDALGQLAGRPFKKFLRKHTTHPVKAILNGTFITSILQSSSVVSLMVLAFVGAGIIELRHAIGIIIGSNLGTTFTGWIVAFFGFDVDIESFSLPFLAFGGLSMVFFSKNEKLNKVGQLLVGFGFMFLGLEYMKSSIALLAENFDISPFSGYSPYLLFFVGFVLTAIIQSSSAAMVIALSALSSGIISLEAAAAMVIGNDLGTTITVILGGIKGTPAKKRVALSHFLFNLVVDVLALLALFPLLKLITQVLGISNPLYTLVAFHSLFNLFGILIFFPFIGVFSRFLERRFQKDDSVVAKYISQVPAAVPEAAIEALRKETQHLVERVLDLHLTILELDKNIVFEEENTHLPQGDVAERYAQIKELEGELTEFFIDVQNQKLNRDESAQLRQLTHAIRQAMSAAKSLKDISHNIRDISRSVNDYLLKLVDFVKYNQLDWYRSVHHIFKSGHSHAHFEALSDLKKQSKRNYNSFLEQAYRLVQQSRFSEIEISTLFNVNREIHSANKSLLLAVKDLLLQEVQAKDFDTLAEL